LVLIDYWEGPVGDKGLEKSRINALVKTDEHIDIYPFRERDGGALAVVIVSVAAPCTLSFSSLIYHC
jgi:hypothetical protein